MTDSNPNYTLEEIAYLAGDSASEIAKPSNDGKPMLAIGAAAIWPGLGHLLAGRTGWASAVCAIWIFLVSIVAATLFEPRLLPALILVIPLGVLFQLCQMLHAAHCAKRSERARLRDPTTRFIVGVALSLLGMGECYATVTYLQNNWFEICYTPTPSMSPNVAPGDFFLNFKQQPYNRWDIVGVNAPPGAGLEYQNLCKRIVGMPGDCVEITGSGLSINGRIVSLPAQAGPYLPIDTWMNPLLDAEPMAAANGCWGRPIILDPDEYFLLGDNSPISYDGRLWPSFEGHQPGATPRDDLCGRIVAIIWPPQRWRIFDSTADGN